MTALLILSILTGLDNLQVSTTLGMMEIKSSRKWRIALAFGLCEGGMPLLGLIIGKFIHGQFATIADQLSPIILGGIGLTIILLALRQKDSSKVVDNRWTLYGLPLSLSLDNLLAGAALGALGYPVLFSALVVGSISVGMCVAGLLLGGKIRQWLPERIEMLTGSYLILIAAIIAGKDHFLT